MRCTVAASTPIAINNVVHECRRSCSRMLRRFARRRNVSNARLTFLGSRGVPFCTAPCPSSLCRCLSPAHSIDRLSVIRSAKSGCDAPATRAASVCPVPTYKRTNSSYEEWVVSRTLCWAISLNSTVCTARRWMSCCQPEFLCAADPLGVCVQRRLPLRSSHRRCSFASAIRSVYEHFEFVAPVFTLGDIARAVGGCAFSPPSRGSLD